MSNLKPPVPPILVTTEPKFANASGPVEREYHRLHSAAKQLGYEADDLLHLGALGRLEIIAPVIAGGDYQWTGFDEPEVEYHSDRAFDATDRVFLSCGDLAHLEGYGWAVPRSFYTPVQSLLEPREAKDDRGELVSSVLWDRERIGNIVSAKQKEFGLSDHEVQRTIDKFEQFIRRGNRNGLEWLNLQDDLGAQKYGMGRDDLVWLKLHEIVFGHPWCAINPPAESANKTTIDHLFISNDELIRLVEGRPHDKDFRQRGAKGRLSDGYSERQARRQLDVLRFAVYCKSTWPDECQGDSAWARTIENKARHAWPVTGNPPLKSRAIRSLLAETKHGIPKKSGESNEEAGE